MEKINWAAIRAQFKFDVQTGCPILDEYEYDNFEGATCSLISGWLAN